MIDANTIRITFAEREPYNTAKASSHQTERNQAGQRRAMRESDVPRDDASQALGESVSERHLIHKRTRTWKQP
jgi:hypothetical protein